MKAAPRSIRMRSTYSSGWCTCSIESGAQTAVEKPASWNWPASAAHILSGFPWETRWRLLQPLSEAKGMAKIWFYVSLTLPTEKLC